MTKKFQNELERATYNYKASCRAIVRAFMKKQEFEKEATYEFDDDYVQVRIGGELLHFKDVAYDVLGNAPKFEFFVWYDSFKHEMSYKMYLEEKPMDKCKECPKENWLTRLFKRG